MLTCYLQATGIVLGVLLGIFLWAWTVRVLTEPGYFPGASWVPFSHTKGFRLVCFICAISPFIFFFGFIIHGLAMGLCGVE